MYEETRSDAFDIMIQHASEIGANEVVGVVRYALMVPGNTEVLSYGTAMIVKANESGV